MPLRLDHISSRRKEEKKEKVNYAPTRRRKKVVQEEQKWPLKFKARPRTRTLRKGYFFLSISLVGFFPPLLSDSEMDNQRKGHKQDKVLNWPGHERVRDQDTGGIFLSLFEMARFRSS